MGWGDGADFVLASWFLGVPHPTGYPAFVLAAKLLGFVPVGDAAFRVGLLSSLSGAGAAALVFILVGRWTAGGAPALYAAAAMALSSFLFGASAGVEAYALNAALCLALIAVASAGRDFRFLPALAFAGALALGNHGTAAFPVAVLLLWALARAAANGRARAFLPAALMLGLLGISLYACLPAFSARTDLFDWNRVERFGNMPFLVSGYDFWVIGEYRAAEMSKNALALLASISGQLTPLAAVPFFAAFFLPAAEKAPRGVILSILLLSSLFPVLYPTKEKESFFLIAFAMIVLASGAGLAALAAPAGKNPALRTAAAAAILCLAFAHAALVLVPRLDPGAARRDETPRRYTEFILDAAPRDSLVFLDHVADDTIAPPLYFQFIENTRKDVFVFHRLYLAFPWYMEAMRDRCAQTGCGVAFPEIDLEEERHRLYPVTLEEAERLEAARTMNTVGIDIQTLKLIEANEGTRAVLINTPSRFRLSLMSRDFAFVPRAGLFMVERKGRRGAARRGPPGARPPASPSASRVYNALMNDFFYHKALHEVESGRLRNAAENLNLALKFAETRQSLNLKAWIYFRTGREKEGRREIRKLLNLVDKENDFH
ncbi:MAG: DUF2723 domain-containing protein [bacterium]